MLVVIFFVLLNGSSSDSNCHGNSDSIRVGKSIRNSYINMLYRVLGHVRKIPYLETSTHRTVEVESVSTAGLMELKYNRSTSLSFKT